MPATEIVVQDQLTHALTDVTFVAGDASNGMTFKNNGFCKIIMKTGVGGTGDVTVQSIVDANRRTGNIVIALGASKVYESSFFEIMLFNQGGNVNITIADDTDLEIAVIRQQV